MKIPIGVSGFCFRSFVSLFVCFSEVLSVTSRGPFRLQKDVFETRGD